MKKEVLTLNSHKHVIFSKTVLDLIVEDFTYQKEYWIKDWAGRKKKMLRDVDIINKVPKKPLYYVGGGFLHKIKEILKKKKIEFSVVGENGYKEYPCELTPLKGIDFRGNQKKIIEKALKHNRGVIHAYTSFGKTFTAANLINSYLAKYLGKKAIFLAHRIDLVEQTNEEFIRFGLNSVVWKGKSRKMADVVCVTRQTLKKTPLKEYADKFLICIRDECHNAGNDYEQILFNLNSPVRYGVTATLPNDRLKSLELEGSVGPVVGTVTIQEGAEMGILAVPEVYMVSYEDSGADDSPRNYFELYDNCIVENVARNQAIFDIAENALKTGESTLIFVREKEHVAFLEKSLKKLGVKTVAGETKAATRMKIKKELESKETKVVVCSTIWNEGISVKSINNIIVGGAGKDDKMVMQIVGRGTRIDEGKNTVKIWDFVDPYKSLSVQCLNRMRVYSNQGWEVKVVASKHSKGIFKNIKGE